MGQSALQPCVPEPCCRTEGSRIDGQGEAESRLLFDGGKLLDEDPKAADALLAHPVGLALATKAALPSPESPLPSAASSTTTAPPPGVLDSDGCAAEDAADDQGQSESEKQPQLRQREEQQLPADAGAVAEEGDALARRKATRPATLQSVRTMVRMQSASKESRRSQQAQDGELLSRKPSRSASLTSVKLAVRMRKAARDASKGSPGDDSARAREEGDEAETAAAEPLHPEETRASAEQVLSPQEVRDLFDKVNASAAADLGQPPLRPEEASETSMQRALAAEPAAEQTASKVPDSVDRPGAPVAQAKTPQGSGKTRSKKAGGGRKAKQSSQQKQVAPEKDEFGRDIKRLQAARGKGPRGRLKESSSDEDEDLDLLLERSCPAEKKKKDFDRDLKALKKKMRAGMTPEELEELDNPWLATQVSDSERKMKKEMFVSFYREQYARLAKASSAAKQKANALDTSQYSQEQTNGLKISEGHRPMPRPKNVELPKDFRQPVGMLTADKLKSFDCNSKRMLICIHGDLFDVSDRPDKYAADGPYAYMAGHDISWGLVVGDDGEDTLDKYYDLYKIQPTDVADRKLQGLISWWCFYEREYGKPVGRLDVYNKEWGLPPPPADQLEGCCVM